MLQTKAFHSLQEKGILLQNPPNCIDCGRCMTLVKVDGRKATDCFYKMLRHIFELYNVNNLSIYAQLFLLYCRLKWDLSKFLGPGYLSFTIRCIGDTEPDELWRCPRQIERCPGLNNNNQVQVPMLFVEL